MYLITSDETMDPQVIPKRPDKKCSKVTDKFPMQFGSYLCDTMEENIMMFLVIKKSCVTTILLLMCHN